MQAVSTAPEEVAALSYEQALEQLDTLIAQLEKGDIPLDDAISAYERGTRLARHCAELLDRTEQRVSQLVVSGDGTMSEKPLEAHAPPEPGPPRAVRARVNPDEIPF